MIHILHTYIFPMVAISLWICYLMFVFREKISIEVAGSTIQSNDIEHVSHLFSRNKWAISLQNCAQFHMWQFCQDLFFSWGKNPYESDFLRNISRENWIWLDNVWLDHCLLYECSYKTHKKQHSFFQTFHLHKDRVHDIYTKYLMLVYTKVST
jgi:hypothetical protein